jgi:hypothetical protein
MDAPPATPPDAVPAGPRRETADRRERPTPMLSRYFLFGRRREGRREGERERIYVDRPGAWVVVAFALVTLLSVADALFTLHELSRGGSEANPVMRAALNLGNTPFVLVKTVMTIAGAGFLALHKNWPLGRACLWFAALGYVALTAYHAYGIWVVLPAAGA